jgi:hypothetical protein
MWTLSLDDSGFLSLFCGLLRSILMMGQSKDERQTVPPLRATTPRFARKAADKM